MFHHNALCVFTILTLAACTPVTAQRGNLLEDFQIAEIEVGQTTRSDILRQLGSPTTTAPFNQDIWFYIGQETEKRGILDPEVTKERIVVVTFDDQGIVQDFKESDEGRINIPIDRNATPTHGQQNSVVQQLLGNIGKFNPQTEE